VDRKPLCEITVAASVSIGLTFHLRLGDVLMSFWHAVPLVNAQSGRAVSSSGGSLRWCSAVVAAATGTALMLVWLQSAALARLSPTNVITDSQCPLEFQLLNSCASAT
jgi:hypothetical protein